MITRPCTRLNGLKTIPFPAAHTLYSQYMGVSSPPPHPGNKTFRISRVILKLMEVIFGQVFRKRNKLRNIVFMRKEVFLEIQKLNTKSKTVKIQPRTYIFLLDAVPKLCVKVLLSIQRRHTTTQRPLFQVAAFLLYSMSKLYLNCTLETINK